MKLIKELPYSLFHSWRLKQRPLEELFDSNKPEVPVVISLASIEPRLGSLHLVIRSLLDQSCRPKKILIWLNHALKSQVPAAVHALCSDQVELHFTPLNSPHKKLVGTLELYPDELVLTCDDDMMYHRDWLRIFWEEHQKRPAAILAVRTVYLRYDQDNQPLPSAAWRKPAEGKANPRAYLPIGQWGTLYPPNSLSPLFKEEKLFMRLCPQADDLWFKTMALLQGTHSLPTEKKPPEPIPILGTQKVALKKTNVKQGGNTRQWRALSTHFDLPSLLFLPQD